MTTLMAESTATTGRAWGGQSMVAPLKRVLVRKPAAPQAEGRFADFGYPRAVDHDRTEQEHDAFRALLTTSGAEVIVMYQRGGYGDLVEVAGMRDVLAPVGGHVLTILRGRAAGSRCCAGSPEDPGCVGQRARRGC